MNHRQRFVEIIEFLKPYQNIWQNEIMLEYPAPFKDYPMEWVHELAVYKNKADVIKLELKQVDEFNPSVSLKKFYSRIEELSAVEQLPETAPLKENRFTFLHTIPKKQHEIRRLAPFINHVVTKNKISKVIDIGGGIGKLAQTLLNHYEIQTISIDMDPVLQKTGKTRHEKYFKNKPSVNYVNAKVNLKDLIFQKLLQPDTMTVGLHTCGPLANHQIRSSATNKIPALLSFGCCYHKLEVDPDGQNISSFAKNNEEKLEFGHFALTLSARAHRKMDEEDYDLKQKVKYFRYAIHFLLYDEYDIKELVSLGNSSPQLYDEDFATYATEQLTRIKIPIKHSKQELNEYFNRQQLQKLLWDMIASGLIRNSMGRLLEMYILLDRAIYLEEQGYQVKLFEFFEEQISPRNIGIYAEL